MAMEGKKKGRLLVTNDDGIDAPGIRNLVQVLVSTDRYEVYVCAPDCEKSSVSHYITTRDVLCVTKVEIEGATAYSVTGSPADCACLGVCEALFDEIPDLVLSGINKGSNCGYHIVYSGTVAGAREALLYGVPSISMSYNWVGGDESQYRLCAEACLRIIDAALKDIEDKTFPHDTFLNIDFPTDIAHHKGYRLTRQGKSMIRTKFQKRASPGAGASNVTKAATKNIEIETVEGSATDDPLVTSGQRTFFKRMISDFEYGEGGDDVDLGAMENGYISITPIGALSHVETQARAHFGNWPALSPAL